ncbi:MAG: hypothetical protein LQ350_006970 [Teloschistes chrysophthalmus]|nr:MAG: hypothetical protein LQ350_006970 [Niorma chrysophthalma]
MAKLHLPLRQKLGAIAVFFAGLLACLSGIFALYYRIQLLYTMDLTWHATPVVIFTQRDGNQYWHHRQLHANLSGLHPRYSSPVHPLEEKGSKIKIDEPQIEKHEPEASKPPPFFQNIETIATAAEGPGSESTKCRQAYLTAERSNTVRSSIAQPSIAQSNITRSNLTRRARSEPSADYGSAFRAKELLLGRFVGFRGGAVSVS